ncbi:MAG: valine--tRNA ligase [Bacilli bacterium]|nr:valine--tRNA ligase [Bacilli bacterium]
MLDKKYNAKEKEAKWLKYWEEENIYKFKENKKPIYSIDTPPPTVNGNIHIGHIFSYSQTEMIARYKRLTGFNVFYPFGFDDNGLPSERLVEKEIGQKASEIGREEFNKQCYEITNKYEMDFKNLFSKIGVSTDWSLAYKTISPETIKISQISFLDLVHKKRAYQATSPALWCSECLTTIAQAELETKSIDTSFNYIRFTTTEDKEDFLIATTRPELLPAIVSVFVNPDDDKNKRLIGKTAKVPLLNIEVPIMADEKVAISKGTGIVMCCTFGDQTDIEWYKKYNLPLKHIFTEDGKIKDDVKDYGGLSIKAAKNKVIEDLEKNGYLVKQEPLNHEVQVHERCGKEVEYSILKQWFIDIMNYKEDFLRIGNEISWHPLYMQARYIEWVNNVAWDWCISRQRYFGVPFPVWYCDNCKTPVLADIKDLPVNPLTSKPNIKTCLNCGNSNFIPDKDVMDTWATSSVTPLINMKYGEENNKVDLLKPMSLRTNAHDIIRTWDFYTIVKKFHHFNEKPWDNLMISGFVMANKGEKISKRKSNSKNDPLDLINEYSADVVRYLAGSGRLGTDMTYSEETFLRGKKLVNKIFNASKFVEMHLNDYQDKEFNDFAFFDKWILGKYYEMEEQFLNYLEEYEVGLGLNTLEKFFWNFCDNYLEIVKHRLYRPEEFGEKERYSGQKTVYIILYKLLQKFSIYFPFITEEIFQEIYHNEKSIHLTSINKLNYNFINEAQEGNILLEIISSARGAKTDANVSLKTPIEILNISLNEKIKKALDLGMADFKATLFIKKLIIKETNENYIINELKLLSEELDTKI